VDIVELWYGSRNGEPETRKAGADYYGVTSERVGQILAKSLTRSGRAGLCRSF
jgi:DNA-directed RNA polymerase sigma subunit (sigma70/sigma32)